MNILPKKSWHVRNKKNIERVRRDEENAANELKERERRIALAESEARSDVLRQVARKRKSSSDIQEEPISHLSNDCVKHLNFFQDLEAGEKTARKNKQHEDEIRKEKEKQEKAIGLLTYLGQGSSELEDKKPWYGEAPSRDKVAKDELDLKKKRLDDPLLVMTKYLEVTEKYEASKSGKLIEKRNNNRSTYKSKTETKSIEQLRMERIEREKKERIRQQQLLDKHNNVKPVDQEHEENRGKKPKYNQQYYPYIMKQ